VLNISGLSISYGAVEVVHGVTMAVDEGQIVALIGPNGAGKSSVLRAVSGLIRPTAGDINFLGASLIGAPPHEIALAGVAHVMEGRHLFGGLSVEDNLVLAGAREGGAAAGSLEGVFQRWPRLRERRDQLAGTLSGGEQQMLAIGRALMTRPRLLMLDEPSWGLAPRVVRELMATIVELRQGGATILLVEQMANLALKICDYAYVMTSGRIALEGSSQELLANPALSATYLGGRVGEAVAAAAEPRPAPAGGPVEAAPAAPAPSRDRAERERERHERAKRQPAPAGLPPAAPARPPAREVSPGPALEERERLRQMREQAFDSQRTFSDLKEELSGLRREVSTVFGPRPEAETKPSRPGQAGLDRRGQELLRQERQVQRLQEPPPQVRAEAVGVKEDRNVREAERRRLQAEFSRQAGPPPSDRGASRSERERERQSRQQEQGGTRPGQEGPTAPRPRPELDRRQLELQRQGRAKAGPARGPASPGAGGQAAGADRRDREKARQQRQAERAAKNRGGRD